MPDNIYYSGQGSLLVSERDSATGKPRGFVPLGNVPSLEISIAITKFEHKESETGQRAIDLTIVQEKNATFTMTLESLSAFNLALAFWGEYAIIPPAVIADEALSAFSFDMPIPLSHVNLLDIPVPVVTDGDVVEYDVGADYTIDLKNGTITFVTGGAIVLDQDIEVSYSHGGYTKVDAFTVTSQERYLRFQGLNTVDGKPVIIDLYRASLDPVSGYNLINEEIGSLEVTGNILLDTTQTGNSQFFTQRNVTAPDEVGTA